MKKTKKLISLLTALCVSIGSLTIFSNVYAEETAGRMYEQLDRGLAAMKTDDGIYLSWRFFDSDKQNASSAVFNVYRDGNKVASVDKSTNYIDKEGTETSKYMVALVRDGAESEQSKEVSAFSSGSNYFDIPVDVPENVTLADKETYSYSVGDASCGDLDGDGEYEIVFKWEANAKDNSQSGYTGNVLIDAYKLDGTKLWRIDLGPNIRSGAHYTQFMVYDLDRDGKAEVAMKTAPGSKDGKGGYVNEKSSDEAVRNGDNSKSYVDSNGYILSGPEYYTVFDGETGEAIDTISYPVLRGFDAANKMDSIWGDTYGNRVDRFLSAIAHLDGITPSIIAWRGYYYGKTSGGRTGIAAISFDGSKLSVDKYFDTYSKAANGYTAGNEQYVGQGNHSMAVGDVDNDGRDEFMSGSLCIDDDFSVKWCVGKGHGDAHHLANYDPTNGTFEYFIVHESAPYGMSLVDAYTGEVKYHEDASADTGRGIMANVGAGGYYQFYSAKNGIVNGMGNNNFVTSSIGKGSVNFRIFWDGDLYDELLDKVTVSKYVNGRFNNIFTADGCIPINGTKANPSLLADLFGDWREEIVYPTSDNKALRVFTTNIPTEYRIPTLMHDDLYRAGVAAENVAYNQPPHIGYVLSEDNFKADVLELTIKTQPSRTEFYIGEDLDLSDMELYAKLDDGTEEKVTDYTVMGYDKYAAESQTAQINYRGKSVDINIVYKTDMQVSGGKITGYNGSSESAVIPKSVNGKTVTAILKGAFTDTSIKVLTVPSNINEVEDGSIADNIKLICQKGSAAHIYALDHNMETEITEINTLDSFVNTSFSENSYSLYKNKTILAQSRVLQEQKINGILYHVGGRPENGDGYTGFKLISDDRGEYLESVSGRFSTSGRNAIMTFNNAVTFEGGSDYVFSTDICFPKDIYGANMQINISDGMSVLTSISKESLGAEYDKWYKYALIYHDGEYTQVLYDENENIISMKDIKSDVLSIAKLEFVFINGPLGNNQFTSVYLDNIKIYSSECALSDCKFEVSGENEEKLSDSVIEIAGQKVKADENGIIGVVLPSNVYKAVISAPNYKPFEFAIPLTLKSQSKRIELHLGILEADLNDKNELVINNITGLDIESKLIISDGTNITVSDITVKDGENAIPVNVNENSKIFVWDSNSLLKPVTNAVKAGK